MGKRAADGEASAGSSDDEVSRGRVILDGFLALLEGPRRNGRARKLDLIDQTSRSTFFLWDMRIFKYFGSLDSIVAVLCSFKGF